MPLFSCRNLPVAFASAVFLAATPALASTIFYDSFEAPIPDDGRWQVYQQVGDHGA